MADYLHMVCNGNIFFVVRDIVLNTRVLDICKLISCRDQMYTEMHVH